MKTICNNKNSIHYNKECLVIGVPFDTTDNICLCCNEYKKTLVTQQKQKTLLDEVFGNTIKTKIN